MNISNAAPGVPVCVEGRADARGHRDGEPALKVIRSRATRMFLTQGGGWTDQVAEAAHFAGVSPALGAAFELGLRGVELCVFFSDLGPTGRDFALPLI
jgi:hypothetical protein